MGNETDSILETYLYETNSLLDQMDELLIEAEKNADFTEDDINSIFRSMHTIKGSSAMLEFNSLMEIAHHIEDLFFYIRENGTGALSEGQKTDLFSLMFKSTDRLREEVGKVENGEALSTNIDEFVGSISSFLAEISGNADEAKKEGEGAGEAGAVSVNLAEPYVIRLYFDEGCGMENLRAFMLVTALKEQDLSFTFSPENVETDSASAQAIIEEGFWLGFQSREDADSAAEIVSGTNNVREYEVLQNTPQEKKEEPEKEAPRQQKQETPKAEKKQPAPAAPAKAPVKQNLISVNLDKLDSLVALVGEIVIAESMVTSSPDLKGLKLDNFQKQERQLRKLIDDLQDVSMSLRMVSVSGVFQRMNRIVRDMKSTLKKDVRLTLVGEDTELDKSIVDAIGDPLMHIVRNSMDHGIEENVQDRIAAGKNPQGEIILSAVHAGNEVVISVKDDGQGISPQKVLDKAKRNNFLTKPEEEYTKKDILALLMEPGFSTNTEVTEYSGRGVGMDVVKKNIESIGGTVTLESEEGEGTCTTLRIPLTLSIVDGMEVSVGNEIFAVPIANIRQSFKAGEDRVIHDAEGHEMIEVIGNFYPIVRLHRMYGLTENVCTRIDDGILMWVEANDKSYCLFVDQLLGEQQIVVKPLPGYLNNFGIKDYGISGCSIRGDGNIGIILDISAIEAASGRMR